MKEVLRGEDCTASVVFRNTATVSEALVLDLLLVRLLELE